MIIIIGDVRRMSSLAPSAFLASAAGTRDLQDTILFRCDASIDSTFDNVQCSVFSGRPLMASPVLFLQSARYLPNNMNGTSLLLLQI